MKELFEDIAAFFNDGVKLNGGQEEALPASPRSDAIEDTGCPFIFPFSEEDEPLPPPVPLPTEDGSTIFSQLTFSCSEDEEPLPPPMPLSEDLPCRESGREAMIPAGVAAQRIGQLLRPRVSAEGLQKSKKNIAGQKLSCAIGTLAKDIEQKVLLLVCGDTFYVYERPIWRIARDNEVLQVIRRDYEDGEDVITSLNSSGMAQLLKVLKTSTVLLVKPTEFNQHRELISLRDGVLDLLNDELLPPSPRYMFTTFLDVSRAELESPCQRGAFEGVIASAFGNDPGKRQLLLEIIGTIISPELPKNFYVFAGASNTGKSVLGEFIQSLVGADCSLNLEKGAKSLAGKYALGDFPGKILAFCFELPDVPLDAESFAQIKQLTGDRNLLSSERKFCQRTQFTNQAKLLFCTNHPIRLSGEKDDTAFWNRLVLLPFENSVPVEKQDRDLLKKLQWERGWIIREALEAYRQLVQRNFQFTTVDIPAEYAPQTQHPYLETIRNFVQCCCNLRADARTRVEELYNAFADYCTDLNLELCGRSTFSAFLGQVAPIRHLKMNGGNKRGIEGLELKLQSPEVSNVSAG